MIDDNISLVEMVKEYFHNHEQIDVVLEAYDGEVGIEMMESQKQNYDVVLLDLIMPKSDGMYVL